MKLFFVFSACLVAYYLILKYCHRAVAFSEYFLYAGLLGMFISLCEIYAPFSLFKWLPVSLRNGFLAILLIILLDYLSFILRCVQHAKKKSEVTPDVIFVFGAGLFGKRLSLSLKTRLDQAVKLAELYKQSDIVVSGGQGPNELISEALAMQQYLIDKGIEAKRIYMEDQSTSTYENLSFSQKIYLFKNKKVALVSNQFHLYRAEKISHRLGIDGYGCAATLHSIACPVFYTREYFAYLKGWLNQEI